jgi:hypothetical protein
MRAAHRQASDFVGWPEHRILDTETRLADLNCGPPRIGGVGPPACCTGFELQRLVRNARPELPVLFITAHHEKSTNREPVRGSDFSKSRSTARPACSCRSGGKALTSGGLSADSYAGVMYGRPATQTHRVGSHRLKRGSHFVPFERHRPQPHTGRIENGVRN